MVVVVIVVVVVVVGSISHSSPVNPLTHVQSQSPVNPVVVPPLVQLLPFFPTTHEVGVSQSNPCHPD